MAPTSGEVTVFDLIAWEPALKVVSPRSGVFRPEILLRHEVDWVMTARASSPMLSPLRGGELIILPDRVAQEAGLPFDRLVNEVSLQPIAGLLTDHALPIIPHDSLVILRLAEIRPETETDLNRLITGQRREMLQRVAEIEQAITALAARNARPGELIDSLSRLLQVAITVVSPRGAVEFTTATSRDVPQPESAEWLNHQLRNDHVVWFGPIPAGRHAVSRAVSARIGDAIQRALDATHSSAPRGSARASALNSILHLPVSTNRDRVVELALAAGIPAGRSLHVTLTASTTPDAAIRRLLQPLGEIYDAGMMNDAHAMIVVSRDGSLAESVPAATIDSGWLAISAAIPSTAELPDAARQARYVARLMERHLVTPGMVRFTDRRRIGAYDLLFEGWESPAQTDYRDNWLGPLIASDLRGQLLETLHAYLESQGAHRAAAEALHIHRNTLSYRLRQIQNLLDVDLNDPLSRFSLQVALLIHRMLD